jgi:uncharacterized protein with von Willebrand factor type A (vWA) domain
MGMSRERIQQIREMIQQNMQGMQDQMEQFAGERIAENLSEKPRGENIDNLMNRPFQALSDEDKKLLQREVKNSPPLRTRIALRQKRAKNGQMDPKATIRASLKYHGVPMEIKHKDRVHKPKIVVICDVSTSMRFCSELMLSFFSRCKDKCARLMPLHSSTILSRSRRISAARMRMKRSSLFVAHAQRTLQHRPRLGA